jgi:hypothetical protein
MIYPSHTKEYRAKAWRKWKIKNRPDKIKVCISCNNPFKQSGNSQRKCDDCRKITCAYCGKKFIPPFSQCKMKFCSKKCYSNSISGVYPKNLKGKRGIKPRTYHLKKRPKHGGIMYKEWRLSVWKRDKFTCKNCGITSNELKKVKSKVVAHHIKSYTRYPELRYDVNNGLTLCIECHKQTENYGSKAINSPSLNKD